MRRGATCVSAKRDPVHPFRRRQRAGAGPGARVVVGHDAELVDGAPQARPVLRPRAVPAAGLAELGVDVDGDEAVVRVQAAGQLLHERRVGVAARALDGLPVDVDAGHVVLAAPGGDGLGVPAPRRRRRQDLRRDGRVERVLGLVVVGEGDKDAAVLASGLGEEVRVQARRDDAAVRARLQPVGAHFVDGARLHRSSSDARSPNVQAPMRSGPCGRSSSRAVASTKAAATAIRPAATMTSSAGRRHRRGPAARRRPVRSASVGMRSHDDGCEAGAKPAGPPPAPGRQITPGPRAGMQRSRIAHTRPVRSP